MGESEELDTAYANAADPAGVVSRRRHPGFRAGILAVLLIASALLVGMPGVRAVDVLPLFELGPAPGVPGALTDILGNAAVPGNDWGDLFDSSGDPVYPDLVTAFIRDDLSQSSSVDRTTFSGAGGSNKNNDPISGPGDTWHWATGNVPAKDDFSNAYAYATFSEEHLIIYAGFERIDSSGDSHVDIEFFHDHVSLDEAPPCDDPGISDPTLCDFVGQRTIGDVIVSMDFLNGGGFGTLSIREWDGASYVLIGSLTGEGCNGDNTICGFNNGGSIDGGPWPNYDRHGKVIPSLPKNAFTEFGIDVTSLEGATPCLSTIMGKTRSSQSFTAELKDFAGPVAFPICDARIAIAPDDVNEVGQEHTFTVTLVQILGGVESPVPDGTPVAVVLENSNGADFTYVGDGDTCASPGTVDGACTVTFTSDSAGIVTGSASATVHILDEDLFVQTDGTGQNSFPAVKRFVDARISIGPDDVNRVGESHTFVVTVEEDEGLGEGFMPASGEDVDFTLLNANGASYILNAASSTCDDAGPNTDGNGQCTIVFTSNSPGVVTGHASSSVVVGDLSVFRETGDGSGKNSDDAEKRFVDARIAIEPDDVNEVGVTHTFVVTVEKNEGLGGGWVAASGEHVDVTLVDTNGASHVLDSALSTCDDTGSNTDGNGQCTIVFHSDSAGLVTGHASASVHVGGLTIPVATTGTGGSSDDATKRYVDAYIAISPSEDTNSIEESHTFTVTVKQDAGEGEGFVDAPDETLVTVTLTATDGATIVDVVDACGSAGLSFGTCTVTFTSTTPGTVTGHASVSLDVYGVTLDRETNGEAPNSGEAVKHFVAGSLAWTKVDNAGRLQGGATFEVCRTHDWNSGTSSYDVITPVCVSVADNLAPDSDPDDGQFLLEGLVLGRYTVHETIPPPGYQADPKTETVDLSLSSPDGVIAEAFVNQRPILKVTAFGYTNTPHPGPTDGVVSGTTVYSFSVENFGGAPALLDLTFTVSVPGGLASGSVVYGGSAGDQAASSEPSAGDSCAGPSGCVVTWSDVPVGVGATVSFTVTIVYDDVPDGTQIRADLAATYTLDPSDGFVRTASGAPAAIIFTVQED